MTHGIYGEEHNNVKMSLLKSDERVIIGDVRTQWTTLGDPCVHLWTVSAFLLKPIRGAAYKRDLKSAIYDGFCPPVYLSCYEG